jgi:non-specific protein-tyrosine kinase
MELRQYLTLAGKWLWLILLSVIIAGASSYFASMAATPIYSTKTTLMVGRVTSNPDPSSNEINTGTLLAQTYSQLARREPVLKGTIESLGLDISWALLANQVRTTVIPQTQLLEISVVDSDPFRAKVLADSIAQQLILQSPTTPNTLNQEQLDFTQAQLTDLSGKIEKAQQDMSRLKQELDAANSSRSIQELQNQVNVLDSKISEWQNTYTRLLSTLQGGNINALTVLEEATIPRNPFSPNVSRNVLLASAVGLILALGGVFLIEYMDDTIKTPEDITRATNLPTLGAIARISGEEVTDKLVAVRHPLSPIVEAFRVLRTNLQYSALDKPLRTMMITSPSPGEGKSLTLANLGVVMAQSGQRVILVDTDLRRPMLHKIFGLSNRYGLSDTVLHSTSSITERMQTTETRNLFVLTSGPLPPNPAEVLGSDRFREIIEGLKQSADIVLMDSPPVLAVADATILGTQVDGVILVARSGRTGRNEAERAVENLLRVRVHLLGAILNRARLGSRNSYYRYYEQEDQEKKSHWLGRINPLPRHAGDKTSK